MKAQSASQPPAPLPAVPLWGLGIVEVTGHNLETAGREEVNTLLKEGWVLLHIYTLRYFDDTDSGTWRERPMAILGRPSDDLFKAGT